MNNINNEALSDMIQRFAISALSRERKGEARIEFAQRSNLSIDKLLLLIKNNPK